jgi:hypothetical protein
MTTSRETPETGSLSVEAVLAALVDIAFRDGADELRRARGQRGVMHLDVQLTLGDRGEPVFSTHRMSFEHKRHLKDDFARERPNGS